MADKKPAKAKQQPKTSSPVGVGLVGSDVSHDHELEDCVCVKCLCLCDTDGTCVAALHVRDGEACLAIKDEEGGLRHIAVSQLLELLDQ